ncbi:MULTISPECIES: D-arabinono-1,4-lactone oxidase [Microbispora]|uniref:L-gulonolactone oxidase n=1 Tax=Microbispora siamensis TaxID=564413 RepID=A0ABQ4GZ49_9ACTN|nr:MULTISPECIES: D-arabinono-1,4-lactone oxidase [Microbispora]OPG12356.1 hypothetical protein B1L11_15175 [Microbispora sp. GKU 823]GIH66731.1 L-gulonolactone oxidase [Microbispora siamensis]
MTRGRLRLSSGAGWRSWSGTVRCAPRHHTAPTSEEQIADLVRAAVGHGLGIRPVGTGHSFNSLATTDGLLLDLRRYAGIVEIDPEAMCVTVRAGTRIGDLAASLHRAGLALPNIGTLADQTVAGAISTGNHGTGLLHPPLSGEVLRLRLVTADGRTLALDRDSDPELFRCARTGLGALGVVSTVTLRCVPAFNLRVRERAMAFEELVEDFGRLVADADRPSFTWRPWQDTVTARELSVTHEPPTPGAYGNRYAATMQEIRCGLVGQAGRVFPSAVPGLTRWLDGRPGAPRPFVDAAHRVLTFPQPVRFIALEHALPLEHVPAALRELRGVLRRGGFYSPYSLLVRVGAGDDAPLSPAYGRRTGYVNLTVPRTAGQLELLRTTEYVLRELDARPHWGKAHTATAELLAPRYPEWDLFQRIRQQVDPAGVFTNDHVARVLGPVRATAASSARLPGEQAGSRTRGEASW